MDDRYSMYVLGVKGTAAAGFALLCCACGARTGLSAQTLDDHTDLVELTCPTTFDDPRLAPIDPGQAIQIDGASFAQGPVAKWAWSVVDQDCDAIVKRTSYTLDSSDQRVVTFRTERPTPYTLELEVTDPSGDRAHCQFELPVKARGLRVELCWDTSTSTDIDLYLHRPFDATPWFDPAASDVISGMTGNTCNPANCPAMLRFGQPRVDWGYADSPLEWCSAGPSAADFAALGRCPNPRAGVDNNQTLTTGTSKVIQIDNPVAGGAYRIMAQNFDNLPAAPQAFVYCAGRRAGGFGPPSRPPRFVADNQGRFGSMWRAADVTADFDASGTMRGCSANAVPDSQSVTLDDPSY